MVERAQRLRPQQDRAERRPQLVRDGIEERVALEACGLALGDVQDPDEEHGWPIGLRDRMRADPEHADTGVTVESGVDVVEAVAAPERPLETLGQIGVIPVSKVEQLATDDLRLGGLERHAERTIGGLDAQAIIEDHDRRGDGLHDCGPEISRCTEHRDVHERQHGTADLAIDGEIRPDLHPVGGRAVEVEHLGFVDHERVDHRRDRRIEAGEREVWLEIRDRTPQISGDQIEHGARSWRESAHAPLGVDDDHRDLDARENVDQIVVRIAELMVSVLQLLVHRLELLVARLQLLLRGLDLLVARLQLLVRRLQLLVRDAELLARREMLRHHGVKVLLGRGELVTQPLDHRATGGDGLALALALGGPGRRSTVWQGFEHDEEVALSLGRAAHRNHLEIESMFAPVLPDDHALLAHRLVGAPGALECQR